jgi:phosphotransferase system enzyme I (PtsI)
LNFPDSAKTQTATDQEEYRGVGVAPGVAIGPVYVFAKDNYTAEKRELSPEEVEEEVERFERAVERSERDLSKIASIAKEKIGGKSAEIFDAQALVLRDEAVYPEVIERIRADRCNADFAVKKIIQKHTKLLEASGSEYLRERVNDLRDVQNRLIRHLQRGKILSRIDRETIVVAEKLTAADIILFSRRDILGCALDYGGPTSHVALMARALGVPAVVGLHDLTDKVDDGDTIILDGFSNRVVVNPTEQTLRGYREKQERYHHVLEEQKELRPLPAETLDGEKCRLRANVEFKQELSLLDDYGAQGIGLFRTEIMGLSYNGILSEDEQREIYREALKVTAPHPATFRLIDLGGDKMLPMAHREHNPFLGWRGMRILLDREELLETQLRAILTASPEGTARILLPMITSLDEIEQFMGVLERVKTQLDRENIVYDDDIAIGIMVEVPSVVLMADKFAKRVDFFSIGTNDLTQYILAVDRGNDLVADMYHELHPAVLSMIARTIEAARRHNIEVSLCGEMAAEPRATPILVGLGLRTFSASPTYLPQIKRVIRTLRVDEAKEIARRALSLDDPLTVEAMMDDWLEEHEVGLVQTMSVDTTD